VAWIIALTLLDEVGTDPTQIVLAGRLRGQQPVDRHDRHLGVLRGLECRVESLRVEGRDDQGLGALRDHPLDVGDLLVEVGLRVRGDELDAPLGRLIFDGLCFGDPEGVGLLLGLGEADGDVLQVELGYAAVVLLRCAAGRPRGGLDLLGGVLAAAVRLPLVGALGARTHGESEHGKCGAGSDSTGKGSGPRHPASLSQRYGTGRWARRRRFDATR
jgi:hypothetical protein